MPFDDELLTRDVFDSIIKPAIEESTELSCLRADDYETPGVTHDQIYTQIMKAKAVVADFTALNPNVMIEIGVAMALGKRVFPFFNKNEYMGFKIPFYINRIRYWAYTDIDDLGEQIKAHVKI